MQTSPVSSYRSLSILALCKKSVEKCGWATGIALLTLGLAHAEVETEAQESEVAPITVKSPTARELLEKGKRLAQAAKWADCYSLLKGSLSRGASTQGYLPLFAHCGAAAGQREEGLYLLNLAAATAPQKTLIAVQETIRILSTTFLTAENSQAYQDGLGWLEAASYGEAEARLAAVLPREAGNVELLLRLGQTRVLAGRAEEGREVLARARALNPLEPEVQLWYGRALFLRGKHQAALDELRRARRLLPESELASTWLSEALVALGIRAQAFQVLEQDLKYYPGHLQVLTQLARFRLLFYERDADMLLSARKEVQLGLSRLDEYRSPAHPRTEGPYGLQLATAEEIRAQLKVMMERIEARQAELKLLRKE